MTEGHVVHLLQHWGDETPPEDLRIKGALGAGARAAFAAAAVAASLVAVALVIVLWTSETPGWWFSLLFTVILLGLSTALWAVYAGSLRTGRERSVAVSQWAESFASARPLAATVLDRTVSTREDGEVGTFDLTVTGGTTATWRPQSASARGLLQTQVPGVGAAVRVWQVPGAPAEHPLVVEALDPSVVPGSAGLEKYAG